MFKDVCDSLIPLHRDTQLWNQLLKDMNDLNLQLLRSAARDKILAILDTISWDDLNQTASAKQIDIEDYIYTSLSELPALGYTNVPSRDIINLICSDDRVVEHVYGGNSKLKQLYNFAYGGVAQSAA